MDLNSIYGRVRDIETTPADPIETYSRVKGVSRNPSLLPSKREFELDFETEEALSIQRVLSKVTVPFFSFETDLDSPHGLWDAKNWQALWQGLAYEEIQQANKSLADKRIPIDALLKIATPAPFGKGNETVFDPKVRKCFEIPAEKLPNLFVHFIPSYLFEYDPCPMMPACKKWTYKLYKMHLYGPEGKFEKHADTLHSSNHVATVVVSLPCEHKGGALVVTNRGETARLDFSAKWDTFQWASFFTDCIHQVEEVTEGWRVVLQYDVYEEENADYPHVWESLGEWKENIADAWETLEHPQKYLKLDEACGESLRSAIAVYTSKRSPGEAIAIFLRHKYSLPALDMEILKGADRLIYDTLAKESKWSLSLCGVLLAVESDYEGFYDSIEIHDVSMSDLVGEEATVEANEDRASGKVYVVSEKWSSFGFRTLIEEEYIEHTGNEAQKGFYSYYHACLVIQPMIGDPDTKPPASEPPLKKAK